MTKGNVLNIDGARFADLGVYTPTFTISANITSLSGTTAQWMQVGNTVTVSGQFTVQATLAVVLTRFRISLPVPSTLTDPNYVGGTANCMAISGQAAAVLADTTNNEAEVRWQSADLSNQAWQYSFTYRIT